MVQIDSKKKKYILIFWNHEDSDPMLSDKIFLHIRQWASRLVKDLWKPFLLRLASESPTGEPAATYYSGVLGVLQQRSLANVASNVLQAQLRQSSVPFEPTVPPGIMNSAGPRSYCGSSVIVMEF